MKIYFEPDQFVSCSNVVKNRVGWNGVEPGPRFLHKVPQAVTRGWYRISVKIEANCHITPRIYFDFGNGFNELEAVYMSAIGRNRFVGTAFLRNRPTEFRFDPIGSAGAFVMGSLEFRALNRIQFGLFAGFKAARLLIQNPVRNWSRLTRSGRSLLNGQHFVSIGSSVSPLRTQDRYALWQSMFDFNRDIDANVLTNRLENISHPAGVSVMLPIHTSPDKWLNEAIESVCNQIHTDWELFIVSKVSLTPEKNADLQRLVATDSRISVICLSGTDANSSMENEFLKLATKPWLVRLGQNDRLAPHAFAEVALSTQENPHVHIFYSDCDVLSNEGVRCDPYFKSGFSPEFIRSENYLDKLTVFRTDSVRSVDGWRSGFDKSKDYDLILRVWDRFNCNDTVHHIPKILYHKRQQPISTADETAIAKNAARRAVGDHLVRRKIDARVDMFADKPFLRVKPNLPKKHPKVSFIIPTKDRADLVRACVRSIYMKDSYPDFEVILIDNNSSDPESLRYFECLSRRGVIKLLHYPYPFNYSAINNWAINQSTGDIIALVNNDIEALTEGWIHELAGWAWQDEVGCVGAKLLYPDDRIQHAGVFLGVGGLAAHGHKFFHRYANGYFGRPQIIQNVSAVTAACLFVRREVFDEVQGLDEENLTVAFNDVDLCLKIREAGYRNVYTPFVEAYHHESVSRGREDNPIKLKRYVSEVDTMLSRWGNALANDPFYNPNLTRRSEDFAIRVE